MIKLYRKIHIMTKNPREFINLEFLIFRRMGIIKSPLLKRNISADKVKKPADLFMLVLNKLK